MNYPLSLDIPLCIYITFFHFIVRVQVSSNLVLIYAAHTKLHMYDYIKKRFKCKVTRPMTSRLPKGSMILPYKKCLLTKEYTRSEVEALYIKFLGECSN